MNDLIKAEPQPITISFDQEALAMRAEALESSALIAKVDDTKSQETAVAAQAKLFTVIRAVEKARQAAKEPLLKFAKELDGRARDFVSEIHEEGNRVTALINKFQEKERVRLAAEADLQNAELDRLEREEKEKLACADTLEEQDAIREEYCRKRYILPPVEAPARAHGQVVKRDYDVTVTDIHLLYRTHPHCVKLTPLISEIKSLLAVGVTPKGVIAQLVTKATVRSEKPEPPIET